MADVKPMTYRDARVVALGADYPPIVGNTPVASRVCYPVAPENGLVVFGTGNEPSGEEMRLAEMIRLAWPRILAEDRDVLVAFWRREKPPVDKENMEWSPQIEVRPDWFGRIKGNNARTYNGVVFYFLRAAVRDGGDEYVQTLVAHEFAHALQMATGVWGKQEPLMPNPSRTEKEEFVRSRLNYRSVGEMRWRLFLEGTTAERIFDYIHSDDERRTREILLRWKFNPDLVD